MKKNLFKFFFTPFLCILTFIQPVIAGTPPNIIGESAILMDRKTGAILYKKNAYVQMYPASTTKILTSILSIENMDVTASMKKTNESVQSVPSDSSHIGLRVGDTFSILDGIYAVMLGSDNYVAHDLGTLLDGSTGNFALRMNAKAKEIGASNSHFVNPHGYHHPDHYTTAYDLALIADYAFKNDTFRQIAKNPTYTLKRENNLASPISFSHTVKLLQPESPYYSPYVIGGKTGFNTPAGRSLVAVGNKDGMELVGVVLKSTSPQFFEDMNALFEYGFENFSLDEKDGKPLLLNHSFSPWAKETVSFALDHQLIDPSAQDYQMPISKKGFIELLMRTVHIAQTKTLDGFSRQQAVEDALNWNLIQSTSILSGYNDPINRETAAALTAQLLAHLNYKPIAIYPTRHYMDHETMSPHMLDEIYDLQQSGIFGSYSSGSYNDAPFGPKEFLSREQGLSIVIKLYQLYGNSVSRYFPNQKVVQNIYFVRPFALFLFVKLFFCNPINTSHIRNQHFWNYNTSISLLAVFKDRCCTTP